MVIPYLTESYTNAKLMQTDFLIQIKIYQYLAVTYQYLVNAYIVKAIFNWSLKTLWPLFMNGVQLSQGYRGTTKRQFTFYQSVPRRSWSLFHRPGKDERLS